MIPDRSSRTGRAGPVAPDRSNRGPPLPNRFDADRSTEEERLLARILESLPEAPAGPAGAPAAVPIGPGDDAAGIGIGAGGEEGGLLLLTVDAAEEGVHFDRGLHPFRAVGRRAVAAAVSDLAAMGGRPVASLVSLVAPGADAGSALEISVAAGERAAELGAPVVGGNLTSGAALGLHVSVVGRIPRGGRALRRSGARAGDGLFVSGALGGAALGLEILRQRAAPGGREGRGPAAEEEERLVRRHLDPEPRLRLGEAVARSGAATAAMDLSDGLALDLHRLAEAAGVGAVVEAARIPCAAPPSEPFPDSFPPFPPGLSAALFGGEDYELLLTGPDEAALAAAAAPERLVRIGEITERSSGIRLRNRSGAEIPLPRRGWDALRPG